MRAVLGKVAGVAGFAAYMVRTARGWRYRQIMKKSSSRSRAA
jgi:hypothetical protein